MKSKYLIVVFFIFAALSKSKAQQIKKAYFLAEKYDSRKYFLLDLNNKTYSDPFRTYKSSTSNIFINNNRGNCDSIEIHIIGKKYIPKIKAKYINSFNNDTATIQFCDGNFGLINSKGRIIKKYEKYFKDGTSISNLIAYSEGFISYLNDEGQYGFLDIYGNIVIQPTFSWVGKFKNGRCLVKKIFKTKGFTNDNISDEYTTVIDSKSTELVSKPFNHSYESLKEYSLNIVLRDNILSNYSKGEFGFIYDSIYLEKWDLSIRKGSVLIYYDSNRNELFKIKHCDYISEFRNDTATFSIDYDGRKFGLITKSGNIIIEPKYDFLSYSNGMLLFGNKQDENNSDEYVFGFMNLKEETIINPIYNVALPFIEENTIVSRAGKYFLINKKGELLDKIPMDIYFNNSNEELLELFNIPEFMENVFFKNN